MGAVPQDLVWGVLSVLVGAVAIAAWVGVMALLRWVRGQEQWRWAEGFVRTAEQMLAGQEGTAKREWVITQLKAKFPKLDGDAIRVMLEDAVARLNKGASA